MAEDGGRIKEKPLHPQLKQQEDDDGISIWGILGVGLVGATATTLSVSLLSSGLNLAAGFDFVHIGLIANYVVYGTHCREDTIFVG